MTRRVLLLLAAVVVATAALFVRLARDDSSHHLVFSTWGTPVEVRSFQRLIERYNATRHPAHPVKLSHGEQNAYTEQLLVQAAARSLPDVIHIDRKDLPLFVHRGLLEDLTPRIDADTSFDLGAFLPGLLPGCTVGGRYYAVPHNFSTLVLYYNRDHFDAEGIPYPDSSWTWDTFLRAARRLTRRDATGSVLRYGGFVTIIGHTVIYQHGGRVLNQALDSCVIASPEAERALQFVNDLSEVHGVCWNILAQNLQWDDMFAGGRLSMIANGRWAAAWYMHSMSPRAVDVAPLPRGPLRRGAAVNHTMAVSALSAKKEEAWEFVKFLTSEEGQRMVNEDGANIPALRSIAASDAFLRHSSTPAMRNRVFLDELPHSVGWPFVQGPYLTQFVLQSQMDLAMRRVALRQATVAQSLREMQDNVNAVIAAQRRVPAPRPFAGSVLSWICAGLALAAALAAVLNRRRRPPHEP